MWKQMGPQSLSAMVNGPTPGYTFKQGSIFYEELTPNPPSPLNYTLAKYHHICCMKAASFLVFLQMLFLDGTLVKLVDWDMGK